MSKHESGRNESFDMDVELFPQEVIDLQRELLNSYHKGLFVKMQLRYQETLAEGDEFDFLSKVATVAGVELDGEYTLEQLARLILPKLLKERLQNTIIDTARQGGLQ